MRSAIEKQLDLIAKGTDSETPSSSLMGLNCVHVSGEESLERVVAHTLDLFKAKFLYFVQNVSGMDELFEASFSKSADSGKPFSR
jgi:hypothetical protein